MCSRASSPSRPPGYVKSEFEVLCAGAASAICWYSGSWFNVARNLSPAIWFFVFPQSHKLRMPQVIGRRPFRVLESSYQLRLEPDALFHVGGWQALPPAAFFALRQIGDWPFSLVTFLEKPKHTLPCRRNEAVTHTRSKDEFVTLVIAGQECIKVFWTWGIASNNKFLTAADAHFHPSAAAPAWLIAAVAALRDDALKPLRTYGRHHFLGR